MFGIRIITEKKLRLIREQEFTRGYITCKATQQALNITKQIINSMFGATATKKKPSRSKSKCQKK